MNQILFATNNQNKLREVREILGSEYDVISLKDIEFYDEIPEPYDTIRENSIHKAEYLFEKLKMPCIAEDSGLEVTALDNKPSAFSARYAGPERDDYKNTMKVLTELEGGNHREAKFVSIFTFKDAQSIQSFEGVMNGHIHTEPRGTNGFGYDPIFIAEGEHRTNAELSSEEKNKMSHRKKALTLLIDFLKVYKRTNGE
jgi:XTP/dITP diphosphohydrolase